MYSGSCVGVAGATVAVGTTVGTRVGVGAAGATVGTCVGVGAAGATVGAPVDVESVEQARTRKRTTTVARYRLVLQIPGITIPVPTARFRLSIPLSTVHFAALLTEWTSFPDEGQALPPARRKSLIGQALSPPQRPRASSPPRATPHLPPCRRRTVATPPSRPSQCTRR